MTRSNPGKISSSSSIWWLATQSAQECTKKKKKKKKKEVGDILGQGHMLGLKVDT